MTAEHESERNGTGTTLRRRGILAAAGSVIAALAAKQVAAPVAAANPVLLDTDNASTGNTNIHGPGGLVPFGNVIPGLTASFSVENTSTDPNVDGIAVKGNRFGLYAMGSFYGVYGLGVNDAYGVYGFSERAGIGVYGLSTYSHGVLGLTWGSPNQAGVFGAASTVFGPPGSGGVGVYGTTDTRYGVLGNAGSQPGAAGVVGFATNANAVAIGAGVVAPATIAGWFNGDVFVTGRFYTNFLQTSMLDHPDGSKRLVYNVAATENWVEDLGKGQLVSGKASVRLDPEFLATVQTDDYRVFLTPLGDCKGLYVASLNKGGFDVRELQNGNTTLDFHWRVVARPKSDRKVQRLAKFDLPKVKMPTVDDLPKLPPAAVRPKK